MKILSVHSAWNDVSALSRTGEGEDGEEEEWRPTSVTSLPVQVGSPLAASAHGYWLKDNLHLVMTVLRSRGSLQEYGYALLKYFAIILAHHSYRCIIPWQSRLGAVYNHKAGLIWQKIDYAQGYSSTTRVSADSVPSNTLQD